MTVLMTEIKTIICSDLRNRYDENIIVYSVLFLASFLGVRFKIQHLQNTERWLLGYLMSVRICSSSLKHSSATNSPPPTQKLKGLATVLTQIEDKTILDTTSVSVSDKLNWKSAPI